MSLEIKKAERTQLKLRLALTGPSGSGKTYSALSIAKGLGSKILLVDTENHSSTTYADEFEFDIINLEPPYTIEKYLMAIRAAVMNKYDVLILDSISHAWAGQGGLLEKKSDKDTLNPKSNQWANWASITKEQEQFIGTLLNCDIHLISTMRSKQEYVLEANEYGKQVPIKKGMAPIQREGVDFEFGVVMDLDIDHKATVSKTRIKFLDGQRFTPSVEIGAALKEWLGTGKAVSMPKDPAIAELERGVEEIRDRLASHCGGDTDAMNAQLILLTEHKNGDGKTSFVELSDLDSLIIRSPKWIPAILDKMKREKIGQPS